MKFFIFLIPNYHSQHWAYLYDAQDTLVQLHQSSCPCSIRRNQHPRSADPNNASAKQETLAVKDEKCDPLAASQEHLGSAKVGTQRAYERDLYSPPLAECGHSLNRKSESTDRDNDAEHLLAKRDNDTSLSKLYGHSNNLLYVNSYEIHPYSKGENFIETESNRNKIEGI